ncbi:hypothetical protein GGI04_005952, partial [Coemansia thaxteri]
MTVPLPSSIYCFTKDCIRSSDWLTHVPSSSVGWAIGGVTLLLACIRIPIPLSRGLLVIGNNAYG